MRVSLVSETYFPQINGVSRSLGHLVRYLFDRGDQVQLLIPRYPARMGYPDHAGPISDFTSVSVPFYPELRLPLARPNQIVRVLRSFNPDIVHIATEATLGISAHYAALKSGFPLVTSYHTNFSQYTSFYRIGCIEKTLWRYLRWFHNTGRATFCPTPSIRDMLAVHGFENLVIWGRGVDCDLFRPDRRDLLIRQRFDADSRTILMVYVGRIAKEKNIEMLIDAINLLPSNEDVRLVLVGDGPLRAGLEHDSGSRIIFAGYRKGEDLAATIASADIMVFPSLTETFGNVVLEGMACGLPVIAFDAPGPGDIIRDGCTGRVVKPISPQALCDAIMELLRHPEQRETMANQALSYARSQRWESILAVVRDTYQTVLRMISGNM